MTFFEIYMHVAGSIFIVLSTLVILVSVYSLISVIGRMKIYNSAK